MPGQRPAGLRWTNAPLSLCPPLAAAAHAFRMEISPESPVMAPIGTAVSLTCRADGCAAPAFSWRTQIDSPLGGRVRSAGPLSTLTMDPVGFGNEHSYLCTAACGARKAERGVEVHVYCEYAAPAGLSEGSPGGGLGRETSSMPGSVPGCEAGGLGSRTRRGRGR